jgi:hypothetical protein
VLRAEVKAELARVARDGLIVDAARAGMTHADIAAATGPRDDHGLSRAAVAKILKLAGVRRYRERVSA